MIFERCDYLPEAIGNFLARRWRWTPLDKEVVVAIDDSDDVHLINRRMGGTVRAFDATRGMLLVNLAKRVSYEGHYTAHDLDMLVTVPSLRWHGANRLLLTWTAIRVVDAPSFAVQGFGRTIGTGRLQLGLPRY